MPLPPVGYLLKLLLPLMPLIALLPDLTLPASLLNLRFLFETRVSNVSSSESESRPVINLRFLGCSSSESSSLIISLPSLLILNPEFDFFAFSASDFGVLGLVEETA